MSGARGPGQLEPIARLCRGLGWTGARAAPCQARLPHCSCPEAGLTPEAELSQGPSLALSRGLTPQRVGHQLGTSQPFHAHGPPTQPRAARAGQRRPSPSHRGGLGKTGLGWALAGTKGLVHHWAHWARRPGLGRREATGPVRWAETGLQWPPLRDRNWACWASLHHTCGHGGSKCPLAAGQWHLPGPGLPGPNPRLLADPPRSEWD